VPCRFTPSYQNEGHIYIAAKDMALRLVSFYLSTDNDNSSENGTKQSQREAAA